jgi:drug/metabolite transporter (DMT)-like permease
VAYPASALFFPGIVAMAWWFGEQVGPAQIAGAALVMTGVVILLSERETGV